MTSRIATLALASVACSLPILTGCGSPLGVNANAGSGCPYTTLTVSPMPASLAAGTSVTLTATPSQSTSALPTWSLSNATGNPPGGEGSLSTASGLTTTYTAPATPPIYPNNTAFQGQIDLLATLQTGPLCNIYVAPVLISITAPQVSTGVSPATASVALGTTLNLYGYAVGNLDTFIAWQVNGTVNGSSSVGTITRSLNISGTAPETQVVYTAPAAMPVTGPNITITVVSQADPTKTATTAVTLH